LLVSAKCEYVAAGQLRKWISGTGSPCWALAELAIKAAQTNIAAFLSNCIVPSLGQWARSSLAFCDASMPRHGCGETLAELQR
jgi:hypothetical protein